MRESLKCLALFALFLALASCGSTKMAEKVQSSPSASIRPAASYPKIVLYTVSWCPHCKDAKEYLSSRQIPYTNLDIEEDESAREIFAKKYHATTVPLIVIGNDEEILKGFKRETLENALNKFKK
jgi:glutaredoxin 3